MAKRKAEAELRRDDDDMSEDDGYGRGGATQSQSQGAREISIPSYRLPKQQTDENPWIKIRGLNNSFVKSLETELAKDATTDLSRFFEKYLKFWADISEKSGGEVPASSGNKPAAFSAAPFSFNLKPVVAAAKVEEPKKEETKVQLETPKPAATQEPIAFKPFQFTPVQGEAKSEPVKPFQITPLEIKPFEIKPLEVKPFSFPSASQTKEEPAKPFQFSTPLSQPQSQPFDLSTPSKPFTFGGTGQETGAKPFAFSFGGSQEPPAPFGLISPKPTQSLEDATGAVKEAQDEEPLEPATVSIIRTGAGEEDEECKAESRVKLFCFDKSNGWIDLGVGIFKVNQAKEGTDRPNRVLCRGEAAGIILLNSAITEASTKVDYVEGKKELKLTCLNQEGNLATYLIRTKEAAQSQLLTTAINELK